MPVEHAFHIPSYHSLYRVFFHPLTEFPFSISTLQDKKALLFQFYEQDRRRQARQNKIDNNITEAPEGGVFKWRNVLSFCFLLLC